MSRSPASIPAATAGLDAFRERGPRPALHPAERALLSVTIGHLVFLPWAVGTMHAWSQTVSAALGLVALALTLLPRSYPAGSAGPAAVVVPARRLLRFVPFWSGLALLAYVAVQGANPAWRYASDAAYWWLEPLPHRAWLPAGMDTPFAEASPWRSLLVFGSVWSAVCAVWAGLLRRRSLEVLSVALVANGVALALVGLGQEIAGAERILGFIPSSNESFVATFIYRNHAGPWFNLMVALAAGLAWWHRARAERRLEKSSPAGLFAFAAALLGLMVVFSFSRGSVALLLAFVAIAGPVFAVREWRRATARSRVVVAVLLLVIGGFVGVGLLSLRVERVIDRFTGLIDGADASAQMRATASTAAAEMARDRWLFGWGAGSFRYGFPLYQMRHPEIYFRGGHSFDNRLRWEHAHNDWVQFPAELGAVGTLLLLAGPLWLAAHALRHRGWRHPLAGLVLMGAALTLAHAVGDFVFQNPAVLVTWSVLLALAARLAEIDGPPRGRLEAGA